MSVDTLADAVTSFLDANDLADVDVVGNSMGARLVLELTRGGHTTVALDPDGFWKGWERYFFHATPAPSIRLVRLLQPVMDRPMGSAVGRTMLLIQLSARPRDLSAEVRREEMRTFADSPSFDERLRRLAFGPSQPGTGSTPGSVVIGWGRNDRVTLPRQAKRALDRFPNAQLYWLEDGGHYSRWDAPDEATELLLTSTANDE